MADKFIIFYDMAHRAPIKETCFAVNPWKTRLALNFKSVPYTTTWVKILDIKSLRQGLQIPACRNFADGSDFYTLPIIHDLSTGAKVGDSFDIAAYLQQTYPSSGKGNLFPLMEGGISYRYDNDGENLAVPLSEMSSDESLREYAKFNQQVDAAFTAHTALMVHGMPLDTENLEAVREHFLNRIPFVAMWDDLACEGEEREKIKRSLEKTLGRLGEYFGRCGGKVEDGGPFFMGRTEACYADMIVGGWLKMVKGTVRVEEWEEIKGWHGGGFGNLYDALEEFAKVD